VNRVPEGIVKPSVEADDFHLKCQGVVRYFQKVAHRFLICTLCPGDYLNAGTSRTGSEACLTTLLLTLPRKLSRTYPRPWLPMRMKE